MKTLTAILLCGLIFASCSPAPPDVAKARKDIEAITQKAANDMMSGKFDTTLTQYTDDAVSMPNFEPMVRGKVALKEYSKRMIAMGMKFTKVEFKTVDVQVSGSFAFEIGTFTMAFQMPGMSEMNEEGKYLTVYERAADGTWKIKVETWNANQPPTAPAAGS